jgi:hypothetical protein
MQTRLGIRSLLLALLVAAPHLTGTRAAAETKSKLDACAFLTSAEIEAVQGEPVKETKPSAPPTGAGLTISQCFFRTPTFAKSVSLSVLTADPPRTSVPGLREVWSKMFHSGAKREGRGEAGRGRPGERQGEAEGEGEHETSEPRPVQGVGEEAYWTGTTAAGSLFVLQGSAFFRVSAGGVRSEPERIERSKTLARSVAKRLAAGSPSGPR